MQTFICKEDMISYLRGFLIPGNPVEKEHNERAPIPDELRPGIQFCVDKIEAFPADDCLNVRVIETYIHNPPNETVIDLPENGGVVLRRKQAENAEATGRIQAAKSVPMPPFLHPCHAVRRAGEVTPQEWLAEEAGRLAAAAMVFIRTPPGTKPAPMSEEDALNGVISGIAGVLAAADMMGIMPDDGPVRDYVGYKRAMWAAWKRLHREDVHDINVGRMEADQNSYEAEIRAVCDFTGLPEQAVKNLALMRHSGEFKGLHMIEKVIALCSEDE